jgi:hypothetical protein
MLVSLVFVTEKIGLAQLGRTIQAEQAAFIVADECARIHNSTTG